MSNEKNMGEMVDEQLGLQVKRGTPFNFYDAAREIMERHGLPEGDAPNLFFRLTVEAQRRGWAFEKVTSKEMEREGV